MSNRASQWWQRWLIRLDEITSRTGNSFGRRNFDAAPIELPVLGTLESRILFSATPIDPSLVGDATPEVVETESADRVVAGATITAGSSVQQSAKEDSPVELIFIDSAVPNLDQILEDLSRSRPDVDVFVLSGDLDGLDRITEILGQRSDISSIHIVSHSEDGRVKLGNVWLGESNLDAYAGSIAAWRNAISDDADILFYGCDLASDLGGRTFIESISALSGTDVAASDDDTGHTQYGGDWDLEYATGAIESEVLLSAELQQNWLGKLATITVDTFDDIEDGGDGFTSLREAINGAGAGDVIMLTSGTYNVTLNTLDVTQDITITGFGARSTIIDATGIGKQVFKLDGGNTVTMSQLTIQGGNQNDGGGIFVKDSTLYLSDAVLTNNTSDKGGAIYVNGTAHLNNVLMFNNAATSQGGAIHFDNAAGGSLTNVTISGNTVTGGHGGGIWTNSSISVTNSTITLNNASNGGGIRNNGGVVNISNTIVAGNIANSTNHDVFGAFTSDGFNLIQVVGAASGFGADITGISAHLAALTDNGGQTNTHALMAGSGAIHAGTSVGAPTSDQRGETRDGPTDIGAYESKIGYQDSLWLSTSSDVASSGGTGVGAWTNGQALSLRDPNLSLGAGVSDGTMSRLFNLDDFVVDNDANIQGLHYVSKNMTLGNTFTKSLQVGDVLFSTAANEQILAGGLNISKTDVVLFRPTDLGDYSSGTFSILLDDVGSGGLNLLQAFTLVEQTTIFGDIVLQAGDFLYAHTQLFANNDVYWFQTTDVGEGTTVGTKTKVLEGDDLGLNVITSFLLGMELIEQQTTIGGTTLTSGMLLLQSSGTHASVGGANNVATTQNDIFVLDVLQTIPGSGDSVANGSMLLRGADISLDSSAEQINAIAIGPNGTVNLPPTDITLINATVFENAAGAVIGTLAAVDPNVGDTHTWTVDDARFEIIGTQLKLKAGQALNTEVEPSISLQVTATDLNGAGFSYHESFAITVNDVNEAMTDITLSNARVFENADGAIVGILTAIDPDVGDTHTWILDDGRFEIVGTQLQLRAGQSMDHEAEPVFNLLITARDQAGTGLNYSESFTITVDNVNEAPVADADSYSVTAGNSLIVTAPGVLDGDNDPEGDFFTTRLLVDVTGGTLTLNQDGSFTYTPDPGFSGTDSFQYEAWDGSLSSPTTTVTIDVSRLIIPLATPPPIDPGGESGGQSEAGDDSSDGSGDQAQDSSADNPTESDDGNSDSETANVSGVGMINRLMSVGSERHSTGNHGSPVARGDVREDAESEGLQVPLSDTNQAVIDSQTETNRRESLEIEQTDLLRQQLLVDPSLMQALEVDYALMMKPGEMWDELDQQLDNMESLIHGDLIVVGAAGAAASSFTVGVVAWGLRTGFLASGLLAQMPAWRGVDPLLIMQNDDSVRGETLEEMMKRQSEILDDKENQ